MFTSGYLVGADTSTPTTAVGTAAAAAPAGSHERGAAASARRAQAANHEPGAAASARRAQAAKDVGSVPVSSGSGKPSSSSGKPPSSVSAAAAVALPTSVDIPALDLHESLGGLNVVDGTLQVPQKWGDVGWWQDGPTPGERGSAVVVGHVDSPTGPAVFYGLSSLTEGDMILVGRVDRSTATFRVASIELISRKDFPSEQVYRRDGRPTLSLLTCGGSYDSALGLYDSNVVVTAYLVDDDRGKDERTDKHDGEHSHRHENRSPIRGDKVVTRG